MNLNPVRAGDFLCIVFYKKGKPNTIGRGQVMCVKRHFLLGPIYYILCFRDGKVYKTRHATK